MIVVRALLEDPVVGGERFLAVIGPSSTLRRCRRSLLVVSLGFLVGAGPAIGAGASALAWAIAGLASLALAIGLAWIGGVEEVLSCQGSQLRYRRTGMAGGCTRSLSLRELVRIRPPAERGPGAGRGLRLESRRGTLAVGRSLPAEVSRRLASDLERHLGLRDPLASIEAAIAPRSRSRPEPVAAGPIDRLRPRFRPPAE